MAGLGKPRFSRKVFALHSRRKMLRHCHRGTTLSTKSSNPPSSQRNMILKLSDLASSSRSCMSSAIDSALPSVPCPAVAFQKTALSLTIDGVPVQHLRCRSCYLTILQAKEQSTNSEETPQCTRVHEDVESRLAANHGRVARS